MDREVENIKHYQELEILEKLYYTTVMSIVIISIVPSKTPI